MPTGMGTGPCALALPLMGSFYIQYPIKKGNGRREGPFFSEISTLVELWGREKQKYPVQVKPEVTLLEWGRGRCNLILGGIMSPALLTEGQELQGYQGGHRDVGSGSVSFSAASLTALLLLSPTLAARLSADLINCYMPGFPDFHCLLEFAQVCPLNW